MEYFEKGKTYTFEEIEKVYRNASAKQLKHFVESVEENDTKDPMFTSLITMVCMQTMAGINNTMFSERKENKENKEN